MVNIEHLKDELSKALDVDNVWIEVFKPSSDFHIEGELIEGYIRDNVVLLSDRLCIRYNLLQKEFVDVECFGNGRMSWHRCTMQQFKKIQHHIMEIQ